MRIKEFVLDCGRTDSGISLGIVLFKHTPNIKSNDIKYTLYAMDITVIIFGIRIGVWARNK